MIINKKYVLYFHISNIIRIFVIINEQVKDILQAFKRLTSEKASIQEAMDAMHTENDNLRRNVEKLLAENRTLRKWLEKYKGAKKELKQQAVHRLLMNLWKTRHFYTQSHYWEKAKAISISSVDVICKMLRRIDYVSKVANLLKMNPVVK